MAKRWWRGATPGRVRFSMIAAPMEHAARVRGRETVLVALGAAAFLHLVVFRRGTFVYLFHKATTGLWVDEGARVARGETLFRGIAGAVEPGIVYLNAALIRSFSPRLEVLAWAGIVLGVAIALARAGRPRPTPAWAARGAAAAVLAVGLAHGAVGLVVLRQLGQAQVRQRFRAGTVWIGAPAQDLEWIEANTSPGDPILVFPAAAFALDAFRERLAGLDARGSSERIARALVLREPPSLDAGEITDKGTLNQKAILRRRRDLVDRLYER